MYYESFSFFFLKTDDVFIWEINELFLLGISPVLFF